MQTRFITDKEGNKLAVILPIEDYEKLLEELEDIRLYDEAKEGEQEFVDAKEAFKETEKKISKETSRKMLDHLEQSREEWKERNM